MKKTIITILTIAIFFNSAGFTQMAYAQKTENRQTTDLTANVEYTAELAYRSRAIGQPVYLSEEEVKAVYESFQTYGQADSGKKGY